MADGSALPRRSALAGAGAAALAGCTAAAPNYHALPPNAPVEYIVVGSGAGGGPLACNLAKAGHKVLLIEAGGAEIGPAEQVPAFHAYATEDPAIRWDYFVRHYTDPARARQDSKFVPGRDGVWYPRAGTLGGCTTHNAMITVMPHASDWDAIADLTGDASWRGEAMQPYFTRLERCQYRPRLLNLIANPSGHGFDGWLTTELADPALVLGDPKLQRILLSAAERAGLGATAVDFIEAGLDPNDRRFDWRRQETLLNIPLATDHGRRRGTREALLETAQALPNNLVLKTGTLVTRVLFEGTRAVGVEVIEAPRIYRADPAAAPSGPPPARRQLRATREVILCAGAFNSPQILKLSGIGPRDELVRFGIPVLQNLPGVGENLQDRYETGVVTRMASDFAISAPCRLTLPEAGQPDPCLAEWEHGTGPYTTNGTLVGLARRSAPSLPDPDVFIFGIIGKFRGYVPGYSADTPIKDHFTWAILKAHTHNKTGSVRLRSADPRDTPEINFRYFNDANDLGGADMQAMADAIAAVRQMNRRLYGAEPIADAEIVPGPAVSSPEQIRQFVARECWGHHASCTNRIGPATDPMAVVDSRFRVHGTQGLRVVDGSVFPQIPGFFIVTSIYMISEKATDVILADAAGS